MKRVLSLLVAVGAILSVGQSVSAADDDRPNIIFILVDDMGYSDLGSYGSEIDTPNLDQLAEEGIRFTHFYNTAKCFPTRASLLTGTYAHQNNLWRVPWEPLINAVTVGELLGEAGYRTLMSGKHHGVDNPYDRGFDHAYGLLDGASNHFNPGLQRPGEPDPVRKFTERAWMDDGDVFFTIDPDHQDTFPPGFYTTDAFTDKAIEYIETYEDEERPFFLYLAYTAPHAPLMAHPEDIAKYEGVYDVGYEAIREARYARMLELGVIDEERYPLSAPDYVDWDSLSPDQQAEQAQRMAIYAAMIDRIDQNVGRLLDLLREQGELDNTLIMFASDNGAPGIGADFGDLDAPVGDITRWTYLQRSWGNVSNTPFRQYKEASHEGGIVSPLIAYWPAGISTPGAIVDDPVHVIDIMPTVLELGGGQYPAVYDGDLITPEQGISITPAFSGEPLPARDVLYWEYGMGQAIRRGQWKLVKFAGNPWELYNIEEDRTETDNLAEQHPEIVRELRAEFWGWWWSSLQIAPLALDDSAVIEGEAVINVLANDQDPYGLLGRRTLTIVEQPEQGTVSVRRGRITYTPTGTPPYVDSLTYTVEDFVGARSREATVTITVAGGPLTAVPDEVVVDANGTAALNVIANDLTEGGGMDLRIEEPPLHGTARVEGEQIVYEHQAANALTDTFTYTLGTNTATVTVDVEAAEELSISPPRTARTWQLIGLLVVLFTAIGLLIRRVVRRRRRRYGIGMRQSTS